MINFSVLSFMVLVMIGGSHALTSIANTKTSYGAKRIHNMTISGYTWTFDVNRGDKTLPGIATANECAELCLAEKWCKAFTWEKSDSAGTFCFMFAEAENLHACSDCSECKSGKFKPFVGVCFGAGGKQIGIKNAFSELECLNICYRTPGCLFYNFAVSSIKNLCFLFSTCGQGKTPVCEPWQSGQLSFFTPNSTPTECKQYSLMREQSRNKEYGAGSNGDRKPTRSVTQSSNWEGEGWYRMMAPAGTVMPESSPGTSHCGTKLAGWLNASHPKVPGQTLKGKVCFASEEEDCVNAKEVSVTNCGDYFVYLLKDTGLPSPARYCSQ